MEIPVQKWYQAIHIRKSHRNYSAKPIEEQLKKKIISFIDYLNKNIESVRAVFVEEGGGKVVKNIIGSYGLINGVNAYIAFIGDKDDIKVYEKIGYLGESCILELTSLELDTCWIAGFFKKDLVEKEIKLKKNETIFAITPVGYSTKKPTFTEKILKKAIASNKRKSLDVLCHGGFNSKWPEWIKKAIEAVQVAPSTVNQQPWRFTVSKDMNSVIISLNSERRVESKRLDCGIAMLHFETAALYEGVEGVWKYSELPEVAVFKKS
ncbi:nitroreductase family protein [Natronospora cellulosivora (SeqCode)]